MKVAKEHKIQDRGYRQSWGVIFGDSLPPIKKIGSFFVSGGAASGNHILAPKFAQNTKEIAIIFVCDLFWP